MDYDDKFLLDDEQPSPEIIDYYRTLYFGSRRPEFHYLKACQKKRYNTAKRL